MTTLSVRRVGCVFDRRRVLADVTVDARGGEIVGVLGPNGAGKSTLLRILAGQLEPSRGAVQYLIDGERRPPRRARQALGVLEHEPQLYGELTARENLRLFSTIAGMADVDARVSRALGQARLETRADELVERFSRGMRQRLAFERALLHEPGVLLLDVPFTGLDVESVAHLAGRLRALAASGALVILATHDLDIVSPLLDRAWLLREGRLHEVPAGQDLRRAYDAGASATADGKAKLTDAVSTTAPGADGQGVGEGSVAAPIAPRGDDGDDVAAILRAAGAVLAKDVRVEWRRREGVLTTLFFAVACVLVFSFGLVEDGRAAENVGPAVLWVSMTFAGTLAMARTFERERAAGTLAAVLQSPAPRAGVYLGKWLALLCLLLAVDVVLLPLVAVFFQMPLVPRADRVVPLVLVGTAGYAAVGTLFAAMLSRTRTRDVLLPILLYPMTVPVMIGGVRGTAAALAEPYVPGQVGMWLALLLCFGAVFVTLSLWTFDALMTDAAPRAARGD